jgi:hypothetical protein
MRRLDSLPCYFSPDIIDLIKTGANVISYHEYKVEGDTTNTKPKKSFASQMGRIIKTLVGHRKASIDPPAMQTLGSCS